MSEIIEKFLESQNRLVTQSSDLSLESIASMVEGGAIDVSPGYQRRERWNPEKESALIESFILNIPVPPIYLAEDEYGKYTVIDGKQRVTAIYKFMKTETRLKKLERFSELENFSLSTLPTQLKNALMIRPYIRVVTLLNQSDPNLKYEVFTRLNTGGDNLLAQEVRNVAFRGPLNDLIFELSATPFLRGQLKIATMNEKVFKEMVDAEYVLRFFALRYSWKNFPGNMNIAMNNFMNEFRFANAEVLEEMRQLFNRSMDLCEQIWGQNAFHRPAGEDYRRLILQGFYDVQMVPISFYLDRDFDENARQQLKDGFYELYANDNDFQDSIRQFTSNPQRVHYRVAKMVELIENILT